MDPVGALFEATGARMASSGARVCSVSVVCQFGPGAPRTRDVIVGSVSNLKTDPGFGGQNRALL